MIIDKEFEFETEWVDLEGTVTMDISDDMPCVKKIYFKCDKFILECLKDAVEEMIFSDEKFDTRRLREEEKNWQECEDADAKRKESD